MICPKCDHCSWLDSLAEAEDKVAGILVASQLQANTQWEKYRCGREGSTGHGFAAEDANALHAMFNGCVVDLTGRDNSKGGADRISNGEAIQTKKRSYLQRQTENHIIRSHRSQERSGRSMNWI